MSVHRPQSEDARLRRAIEKFVSADSFLREIDAVSGELARERAARVRAINKVCDDGTADRMSARERQAFDAAFEAFDRENHARTVTYSNMHFGRTIALRWRALRQIGYRDEDILGTIFRLRIHM